MLPHQIVELNEVDLLHPILFPFSAVCTVVKNKCSPLKLKLKLHRIHWKSCKNITVIKSFKGKETPKSKESSFFKDGVHIIQSTLLETNLFQEEAHVGLNNRLSLKTKTVQWNQKRHENVSIVSSNKVESLRDMEFDINSNSGDWPEEQCHWLTSWWLLYSCWHATEQSAPRHEGNTVHSLLPVTRATLFTVCSPSRGHRCVHSLLPVTRATHWSGFINQSVGCLGHLTLWTWCLAVRWWAHRFLLGWLELIVDYTFAENVQHIQPIVVCRC